MYRFKFSEQTLDRADDIRVMAGLETKRSRANASTHPAILPCNAMHVRTGRIGRQRRLVTFVLQQQQQQQIFDSGSVLDDYE
jgi:hypothetical protein